MDLSDLLRQYIQQTAGTQGVLGRGLANQQQQLDSAGSDQQGLLGGQQDPQQSQAPKVAGNAAQPSQTPPPGVRTGYAIMYDPKDWTPQEHALFQVQHNIAPKSKLDTFMGLLGIGNAAADTGAQ